MNKIFWNVVSWFSVRSICLRWKAADLLYAFTVWVDPLHEPRAGAEQDPGVLIQCACGDYIRQSDGIHWAPGNSMREKEELRRRVERFEGIHGGK